MSDLPDGSPRPSTVVIERPVTRRPRPMRSKYLVAVLLWGWSVVGWYAGAVLWALFDLVRSNLHVQGTLAAEVRRILLPGALHMPGMPIGIVVACGGVLLAAAGCGVWAVLMLRQGRASSAQARQGAFAPWLFPFAAGLLATVFLLVVSGGQGLTGLPTLLATAPWALQVGVLIAALLVVTGLCTAAARGALTRRSEALFVSDALSHFSNALPTSPDVAKDDYLRRYLYEAAHGRTTFFATALKRMRSQIEYAHNLILYPEQATLSVAAMPPDQQVPPADPAAPETPLDLSRPAPPGLAECYLRPAIKNLLFGWSILREDAMLLVRTLASAYDEASPASADGTLDPEIYQLRASEVVRALRLLLLVQIYSLRAEINLAANDPRAAKRKYQWPTDVIREVNAKRRIYDRLAGLRVLRGALPAGWKEGDDATEYSAWSRAFGTAREGEVGWSPFARAVGYELRYQQRKVELRQRWYELRAASPGLLNPLRALGAAALWLFKVTAGFGFKPRRLAATALGVVAFFSLAYYADEVSSGCKGGARGIADFPREIVYAIGNLTNLGAAEPCGPTRGVLTSMESVIGIFMLSVLAAMLFAWLTDR